MNRDSRLLLWSASGATLLVLGGLGGVSFVSALDMAWLLLAGSVWGILFMVFGVALLGRAYAPLENLEALEPSSLTADPLRAMDPA